MGAIADLASVFRQAGRHRWRFGALAMASTFVMFSLLTHEEARIPPPHPHVIYISSFAPGRSDAQIYAEDVANQKIQDKLSAEQAQRDANVRNVYKVIGRASGMDVAPLERQGNDERAANAKAAAAKLAELYTAGHRDALSVQTASPTHADSKVSTIPSGKP